MTDKDNQHEEMSMGEEAQAVHEPEAEKEEGTGHKQLSALQEKLAETETKAAEHLEGWQRAQAEFANYKKRLARDQEQLSADVRGRVIKRYLDIVDDLELALKNRPHDGAGAEWAQGVELVYRKFLSFLESEGLARMDPLGQPFDANLHEAITEEESADHKSGEIIEVLRLGYMLGDRVLRPAAVKVAK